MKIKVPPFFIEDHISRGLLDPSAVVKEYKTVTVLELNAEQIAELLADAEHYSDRDFAAEFKGLWASAIATAKAVRKQVEQAARWGALSPVPDVEPEPDPAGDAEPADEAGFRILSIHFAVPHGAKDNVAVWHVNGRQGSIIEQRRLEAGATEADAQAFAAAWIQAQAVAS